MLAVELKCERTPELMQCRKKKPPGRMAASRGMLRRPSGANVSEYRTPPPNVTMITRRPDVAPTLAPCSHFGRIRGAMDRPAKRRNARFVSAADINTP